MRRKHWAWAALLLSLPLTSWTQEPDGLPRMPPMGVMVSDSDRTELEAGIATLGKEIEALQVQYKDKPALRGLIADVQIFHNATLHVRRRSASQTAGA